MFTKLSMVTLLTGAVAVLLGPITTTNATTTKNCTTTLKYGAKGDCVVQLQQLLKKYGGVWPSSLSVDGDMGRGTVNAVLNFQSAEHISRDGIVGKTTWERLRKPKRPSNPLPKACKSTSEKAILCASKAERKIRLYKKGKLIYTIPVRFGGMAKDDNGKYKVYPTVNGAYKVYDKDAKAYSKRWQTTMPYSIMFDPNMYVHQSPDFANVGYIGASHGCVNIAKLADAKKLYDATPIGAKVIVY